MVVFVIGLVGFLGVHSLSIASWDARQKLVERLGAGTFKTLFSVVSVATFALMVWGYDQARADPVVLYRPPSWTWHVVWLLMVPVFPLLVATYAKGKISSTLKHPMLVAVKTWALAHLIVNGALADLLLFGGFLAWAVVDRISIKRRPVDTTPEPRPWGAGDAIAIVVGLALYGAFFMWLHELLIGVPVR